MVDIIWERYGVILNYSGSVNNREFEESAIRFQADPKMDDLRYAIHDFHQAQQIDIHYDTLEVAIALTAIATLRKSKFRVVFVGTAP